MHIIKIGDAYVTATGGLSVRQSDALRVDIPTAGGYLVPRFVKLRNARLTPNQASMIDGSPDPLTDPRFYPTSVDDDIDPSGPI